MPFEVPCGRDLRWRITLQAKASAASAGGALTETFTDVASVRARVKQPFGVRVINGRQSEDRVTHIFTIRTRSDADEWRYVKFDGSRYRVNTILRQGTRREWMELMAEEIGSV